MKPSGPGMGPLFSVKPEKLRKPISNVRIVQGDHERRGPAMNVSDAGDVGRVLANPRNARPIALAPLKGGAPRHAIRPPKYRPATRRWHPASYLSKAGSTGTR